MQKNTPYVQLIINIVSKSKIGQNYRKHKNQTQYRNKCLQSSVGAVYPGLMELLRIKVKVQCTGRDCDHNIHLVTSSTGHFITLPLFGRTHVVISIILSQVLFLFLYVICNVFSHWRFVSTN